MKLTIKKKILVGTALLIFGLLSLVGIGGPAWQIGLGEIDFPNRTQTTIVGIVLIAAAISIYAMKTDASH